MTSSFRKSMRVIQVIFATIVLSLSMLSLPLTAEAETSGSGRGDSVGSHGVHRGGEHRGGAGAIVPFQSWD